MRNKDWIGYGLMLILALPAICLVTELKNSIEMNDLWKGASYHVNIPTKPGWVEKFQKDLEML